MKINLIWKKIRFWGLTNYCTCCNSKVRFFLPFGNPVRKNACCPICGSLERQRLMMLSIKQLKFDSSTKILHVAPETCIYNYLSRQRNIKYYPGDNFQPGYTYKKNTQDIDLLNLPFDSNCFDLVICSHVLEHIPDDQKAINEILRVLKVNGKAFIQVPIDNNREITFEDLTITDPSEREKLFGQYDHVRQYGRDFKTKLAETGGDATIINSSDFPSNLSGKYGFLKHEQLFILKKK
jgi:SAM-dependent methyltransferase